MPESKSGALPLGDIPMLTPPREPDEGEKENGVDEGIRTLDLQSHNLTPKPARPHPPYTFYHSNKEESGTWYARRDSNPLPTA